MKMVLNSVLVTGASGFIGRAVCRALAEAGHDVHAFVRKQDAFLGRNNIHQITGDLLEAEDLVKAVQGIDVIVHCAGDPTFGNGVHYNRDNVETSKQVITAAQAQSSPPRVVFLSSIGAVDRDKTDACEAPLTEESNPSPTSDYGRSKLQVERLLAQSNLPFTILRPAMVVGPGMRPESHFNKFASMALSRSCLSRFNFTGRFSVVHVNDLANAVLHIVDTPQTDRQTYFCAGEAVALGDFWRLTDPSRKRISLSVLQRLFRGYQKFLPFSVRCLLFDALVASDNALREVGWVPKISGPKALKQVIDHQRALTDMTKDVPGSSVITGAASGLGKALALKVGPNRQSLILVDKDIESLNLLQQELPHALVFYVDLADTGQVEQLMSDLEMNHAPVAEIFSCAGLGFRQKFSESTQVQNDTVFAVNVSARLSMLSRVLPGMMRQHFGRFVAISSSSAFQPLPLMSIYAASNAALLSAIEGISAEIEDSSVSLTVVCPGGMSTNFQSSAGVKVLGGEKLADPNDVADTILKHLGSGNTTLVLSARSIAMALLARALPRRWSVGLWKRLMGTMR